MRSIDNLRPKAISPALLFSYVLDWIVVIAIAVAAGVLGRLSPKKRPFSLDDPNISLPHPDHETVPLYLALVLCVILPLVVIILISLLLVSVPEHKQHASSRSLVWRKKLWEVNAGLLGLGLAVASAFFISETLKNLFGKPRPHMLSICEPDLANAADHAAGASDSSGNNLLYYGSICQQSDAKLLDDSFRSFPSGHSSCSAAGLIYLSFYLFSKLRIATPFYPNAALTLESRPSTRSAHAARPLANEPLSYDPGENVGLASTLRTPTIDPSDAAGAPVYLVVVSVIPACLAIFIAASRWFDFMHHGFDIIVSFLMGTLTATLSFRQFHMPLAMGDGWAWGPRSSKKPLWAGVGSRSYVDHLPGLERMAGDDIELGSYQNSRASLNRGQHGGY